MYKMDLWKQCGQIGMNGGSSVNIYTLLGVTQVTGEKLLCSTGNPVWCSMTTQRGGIGRGGEEGGSRGEVYMYNYG